MNNRKHLNVNRKHLTTGNMSLVDDTKIVATTGEKVQSLRHEKQRSFPLRRLDLLNRTDPVEAFRNVEYMLQC